MSSKNKTTATTDEARPTLVPKLRFPEFRGAEEWKSIPLNCLAIRTKQKNRDEKIDRVLTNSAEFGVVDQRDYFDKDIATQGKLEGYFVVELGSYVYNPRISSTAPVGPISKNKIGTGVMSPLYTVFKFKDDSNDFYEHYFKTTGWHTYMRQVSSTGARHDRMAISSDDFMAMPLPAPSFAEQQKIAECLSSVDELITAQARKVNALKIHKKGLMQQLFPREGETQPRLRFPEFQNAKKWELKPLNKLAKRVTAKNVLLSQSRVLTNSAEYGIVDQGSYFDREIVTKSNLGAYYIVDFGDFVYNPRISTLAPVGPISRNNLGVGVMSPLYSVFRFETQATEFFAHLFKTSIWHSYLKEVSNSGARHDRMSITTADFMGLPIPFPSPAEQQRIAACLTRLDALITAEDQKLEVLKTHKKGLMQQLFPFSEEVEA